MKIMIVDDSNLLQIRLTIALRRVEENTSISLASSCGEATDLFMQFEPDTVILDIELPDGSGISLLQQFKKQAPTIQVIMLANYPTEEFKKNCMELGADYFFDKSNMKGLITQLTQKKRNTDVKEKEEKHERGTLSTRTRG